MLIVNHQMQVIQSICETATSPADVIEISKNMHGAELSWSSL